MFRSTFLLLELLHCVGFLLFQFYLNLCHLDFASSADPSPSGLQSKYSLHDSGSQATCLDSNPGSQWFQLSAVTSEPPGATQGHLEALLVNVAQDSIITEFKGQLYLLLNALRKPVFGSV